MPKKIKVGLLGFGKTGKLAAKEILEDESCELQWVIRRSRENAGEAVGLHVGVSDGTGVIRSLNEMKHPDFFDKHPVDVVIDFSDSSGLKHYLTALTKRKIRLVTAISQYPPEDVKKLRRAAKTTAILHSPNITLGINVLMVASKVLKKILPHADIEIVEEHFRGKREKSGTALRIAKNLGLDPTEHVNSIRVGGIIGRHEVIFGMRTQTIRLIHESISRAAFARGALFAAKWIIHKRHGLHNMEELIRSTFIENLTEE